MRMVTSIQNVDSLDESYVLVPVTLWAWVFEISLMLLARLTRGQCRRGIKRSHRCNSAGNTSFVCEKRFCIILQGL